MSKRVVEQFQFSDWPDFGCPEDPEVFLKFLEHVRSFYPHVDQTTAPIIVHCRYPLHSLCLNLNKI